MKPPKSIDVFGRQIKITVKKDLHNDEGEQLEGEYQPDKGLINISNITHQCLLHELLHAVINRTGVRQSNLSSELEEVIVENIATFITETYNLRFKRK